MGVYGTMTGRTHEHEALLEHAADWHARLRADDAGAADHGAFAAWLALDPRHRLAYADVCAAAYALDSASAADASLGRDTRASLPARRTARPGARFGVFAGAIGAALIALGAWYGPAPWQNVTSDAHTASGEQRELALPDGSRLVLDGDSAVDIAFAAGERTIHLKRGAAYFDVAPDRARPFVVRAGASSATAVGTRYGVERVAGQVLVEVDEGIVEVRDPSLSGEPQRLVAGEGVLLGDAGGAALLHDDAPLDWTRQRLVFSATPVPVALARLDRRIPGRIVLVGRMPADARVTAAIPAVDAEAGLAAIAREHGLTLRRLPGLGYLVY